MIIGFICNFIKQSFFLIDFEHLVVVFPFFVIKYFDLIVFESRIIIVNLIIIQRLIILQDSRLSAFDFSRFLIQLSRTEFLLHFFLKLRC